MTLDPLKRSRQRQGPSLAFHTIGVQGNFGSAQPPLSEIPGSAPARGGHFLLLAALYGGPRHLLSPSEIVILIDQQQQNFLTYKIYFEQDISGAFELHLFTLLSTTTICSLTSSSHFGKLKVHLLLKVHHSSVV